VPAGNRARLREAVPEIRPFRALRYDPESVGDIAAVVAPPYDVIGPEEAARLLTRHPKNVVRLDMPGVEAGDEPDDRYRRAARTLAAWRSDGTFHKDPRSAVYVYEQTYRVPGTDTERTQRGFFGRLRMESFGAGSGVLPHERTLEGPREDRYRLLRATGVNTSPVVGLYEDASGTSAAILATIATGPAAIDIHDADDVRHRVWIAEAEGDAGEHVSHLLALAGAGPVTIADGHHRYETALRYRDERRMSRSCEEDPAFDYLLMLFLETTSEPLTVLPTHRLVRGLGPDGPASLRDPLLELFESRPAGVAELERTFGNGLATGGAGRFGLWTRDGGSILTARRHAFAADAAGVVPAVRQLDVWLLGVALDRLFGIDDAAVAGGERIAYTKSVADAIARVSADDGGPDAAFLLEATPVPSISAVAQSGEVMPQKSTYFYPKALTGLVINPHEW
jgi:uncharacterized protein (DUF1015 family)